jgi:hypothetical protein
VMTVLQTGPEEDGPPARSCRIQRGQ